MCGIAGYRGPRTIEVARLQRCLALMGRRGPDHADFGRWSRNGTNVYLLHSRLSIIDMDERASQPFHVGCKHLVYNGELYNYLEVKAELESQGRQFVTSSDTEVLLHALDCHGWEGLDACEGMWGFAVYDEADGSLTLCRDRFGEKPLYIYRDETGLYFGSEVKFIVELLGHRLTPNLDQFFRFLVNGYKALYKNGQTFFKDLTELRPGSCLTIDRAGREDQRAYWQFRTVVDEEMTYEEAVCGTRERLLRAVQIRLRADVPLAFCMSGGVDSNALIAIAKRVCGYDVHGFTIANSDARYEEAEMVNCVVSELGLRHTSIPLTTHDFIPRLKTLVRQHDAPVYTITYFVHWLLMEAVADHGYRIAVSGTGADELFSGYYDHHLAYLFDIQGNAELFTNSRRAWETNVQPIVRNPFLRDADAFVRNPSLRDHIFLNANEFAGTLQVRWEEAFDERSFTSGLLRNRMLNELFHETVPITLHEDDLNAMYFSIENRSPYLDRGLFEFTNKIPTRHLIRDGRAKSVLRDAVAGLVPEPVRLNRRKVGFNAPIASLLDARDPAVRKWLLDDSPIFDHLRRDRIEALLDKDNLPNSESKFLFNFVSGKIFLEQFA